MDFVARIGTPEGQVVENTFEAADEATLRTDLERRGFHIFEVQRKGLGQSISLPSLARRRRKVSSEKFLIFNQELAALLKAGLPLLQALDMMIKRMPSGTFRLILEDVRDRVKSGEEMSDAFGSYKELFPRLYPSILKAGERTGEVESVLRRFIRYQTLLLTARKQVVSALIYPVVLVCLSVTMIIIMWLFVVPKFQNFFIGMEVELPLLTRMMISGAVFVNQQWVILTTSIVVGGWMLRRWMKSDIGRHTLDRWRLKLPFIGPVLHQFALSEFCRSLSTLLTGGMPLLPAFEIAVSAVGNTHIRGELKPEIDHVRQGNEFHDALERSGVFPDLSIDMVQVGEATGGLDEMLESVSDFLDDQSKTRMDRILALIEPLMLVFMGIIIAIILISIYLPLFGALGQTNM